MLDDFVAWSNHVAVPNSSKVTPDKRPRRDSIESNFGTPEIQVTPLDEFMTKGGDSRPERRNHNKPLTPTSCNYDLRCELCGKSYKNDQDLELHTISHYMKELKVKVSHYMTEDNKCKICGGSFKKENGLITHLGSKHGFITRSWWRSSSPFFLVP